MKKTSLTDEHQKLKKIMITAFQKEMQTLKPELQSILIDDIITAFKNRLTVLQKIQSNQ